MCVEGRGQGLLQILSSYLLEWIEILRQIYFVCKLARHVSIVICGLRLCTASEGILFHWTQGYVKRTLPSRDLNGIYEYKPRELPLDPV